MNKKLFVSLLIVVGILTIAGILRFVVGGPEDNWICQNGQWIKHGNPSSPMPTGNCPGSQNENQEIIVDSPKAGETIKNPLSMTGRARGSWFFEASAPVKLLDEKGNQIAAGIIQAKDDWMTTEFVPFEGQLEFSTAATAGTLVFENDNPSGLPENSKKFEVPVKIEAGETMSINAYFGNNQLDPQTSCNIVFAAPRTIAKTQGVARVALEEMLKGPTDVEKSQGFYTSINSGVKIQKITIENGVAKVDFDKRLEDATGGSCRVSAIRTQITETLKQFSSVKSVVISIDGRTEDILQP
ncbi:MAG: GerMN domain-containing protein [Candidatus Portnoybacteria bacterium]|nr:GerMN domain-containing protein [Candidatus Portnoybacteria bacterium]